MTAMAVLIVCVVGALCFAIWADRVRLLGPRDHRDPR